MIDRNYTLDEIRASAREIRADMLKRNNEYKKEIETINETYQKDYAWQKSTELRNKEKEENSKQKSQLLEKLNSKIDSIRKQISDKATESPSAEQMALLQVIQLKGADSVSDAELKMIADKCKDNYQALSTLNKLMNTTGRYIELSFKPEEILEELEMLHSKTNYALGQIDNFDTTDYSLMEYYGNYDNGYFHSYNDYFDNSEITKIIEEKEVPVMERLTESFNESIHNKDFKKATDIIKIKHIESKLQDLAEEVIKDNEK